MLIATTKQTALSTLIRMISSFT